MHLVPFQLSPWCRIPQWEGLCTFEVQAGSLCRVSWKSRSWFHHPNAHWFLQPDIMGIYLPGSGTLDCVVWPGAGIALPRYLPRCLATTGERGNAHPTSHSTSATSPRHTTSTHPTGVYVPLCLSPHLHPPTHLDECDFFKSLGSDIHTAQFSDGSGCYLFWGLVVILPVLVWGGKMCSPMPPSWLEFYILN